jgi:chorismate mutase
VDKVQALKILKDSRDQIEKIDEKIIELIKMRTYLAKDIANAKIALGIEIEDKKREDYIQQKNKKLAKKQNIDEESITKIVKILTNLSKNEQRKVLWREKNG